MSNIIPLSRVPLSIRPAVISDIPFIDRLQKANAKRVGWMPTAQLVGKIGAGHVLIAEEIDRVGVGVGLEFDPTHTLPPTHTPSSSAPLGYCIGNDRYFKRDDVGIIYQMNVVPGHRRKLVGASLIQALFDRAAYGCRLYCCWCAQDIEANHFWESIGFIPLAFRTGSAKKARTHIFWQKRIREEDTTTPYWFPSQTNAGAIREDRLVLPIPPDTSWKDAKPLILPTAPQEQAALPGPRMRKARVVAEVKTTIAMNGLRMGEIEPAKKPKAPRQPRPKVKNDPAHVAAARELRDRYLEQFNGEQFNAGTLLPTAGLSGGKYNVSRSLADGGSRPLPKLTPQLASAA